MSQTPATAHAHAEDHGNSPAAWTGVLILLASALLICLGMVLEIKIMWMVGIVGIFVGTIAWIVMARSAARKVGDPRGTTAVH